MKVVCVQENLKNGLTTVSRIILSSNTLPILNNVLLKTENGLLNITATNLEIAIKTDVRCKIETEGEVCLPAKALTELVSTLPNKNITLTKNEHEVVLETEHYKAKVKSLPSEDFPLIPQVEGELLIKIPANELKTALDKVLFATSTNETQPEISGVLFSMHDELVKFVATDRYRLAEKSLAIKDIKGVKEVIVPKRTITELSRIISNFNDEVLITVGENQLLAQVAETNIISRLIDGQYPDYQQIIPQNFATTIITQREELLSALRTSGIFSYSSNSVRMEYKTGEDTVVISSGSQDLGESTVAVSASTTGSAGTILFNFRYLIEALNVMEAPEVVIQINSDNTPVVLREQGKNDYLYLVMPIKS